MNMKIRKSTIIQYFLIYVLICFQGSLNFRYYNTAFIVITFFATAFVILKKYHQIPKHYILFLIILVMSLILEVLLTDGGVYASSIVSIMTRYLIVLSAYWYMKDKFVDRYIKTVVSLALISIVGFAISTAAPSVLKSIMVVHNETFSNYWSTYTVSFYGGTLFAFSPSCARNIGIFHEPGLYQIVLNSALYLMLFKRNKLNVTQKTYDFYMLVIVITLLTAMSTTGIVGMIALFGVYFLFYKNQSQSKIKWFILGGAVAVIVASFFAGDDGYLNKYVFSKIFSEQGKVDFSNSTGSSRILSLISDLTIFKQHPFGIGYLNYNRAFQNNLLDKTISDTSSCVGLTQVLAILGIIVFLIIMCYYLFLMRKNLSRTEKIAFSIFFLNTSLAQPYIWFPAIVVLLLIRNPQTEGDNFELSKYFNKN